MSAYCCAYGDTSDNFDWTKIHYNGEVEEKAYSLKKSRKCTSCNSMIRPGDTAYACLRRRGVSEWEAFHLGWADDHETEHPPTWICEKCGDCLVSFQEANSATDKYGDKRFCWLNLFENIPDQVREFEKAKLRSKTDV